MKKALSLSLLFLIVLIVRIVCNQSEHIIYLIAGIGWASLIITIACIIDNVIKGIRKAYASRPQKIANKTIKRIIAWYIIIPAVLMPIFLGLYFKFLCSNLANDLLSIITIGIAVLDEEITNLFLSFYKDGEN